MRKWLIVSFVILLIVGVLGVRWWSGTAGDYDITFAEVETGPLVMTVETNGTVEPLATVEVGCEVTGKIVEMNADYDQPVTKGQVLCRIDPELANAENEQSIADQLKAVSALADAKLARDELIANLPVRTQQALGQKKESEAALLDAEFNWKRVDDLYKNQNASESEWIFRKTAWMRAEATLLAADAAYRMAVNNEKILVDRATQAVSQAEAALKLAQARLDFTTTRVERCTIYSPIDGVVLRRFMDAGQTVTATFQTPVLFLLAPSLDTMRISAKVGESDISYIEVGQKARFTIDAKQSYSFEGKILHKRSQPDIINNVVTYTVQFDVANPDRVLLPGLSVNVVIECAARQTTPMIANAALRFKPPINSEERQAALDEAVGRRPPRPTASGSATRGEYCDEAIAWQFDPSSKRWRAVALWVGITDNVNTEILAGAETGERFVRKFVDKTIAGGGGLRDAIRLASPENRSL